MSTNEETVRKVLSGGIEMSQIIRLCSETVRLVFQRNWMDILSGSVEDYPAELGEKIDTIRNLLAGLNLPSEGNRAVLYTEIIKPIDQAVLARNA